MVITPGDKKNALPCIVASVCTSAAFAMDTAPVGESTAYPDETNVDVR